MRLLLHIGSPKTGTKAVQHWLTENRRLLARQGIWHPASLGILQSNRLPMMFLQFSPEAPIFAMEGVRTSEDYMLHARRTRSDFEREYRQAREENMRVAVLSSELLQIYLKDLDLISELFDYLRRYFDKIDIVLTVRPQIDAVLSWSSTAARAGEIINEAWFRNIDRHREIFSYHACWQLWSTVFGAGNFHIYRHDRTYPFSLILERLAGWQGEASSGETLRNTPLSLEALRMMNALRLAQTLTAATSAKLMSKTENEFPFRSTLSIGLPLAQWIQTHFDAENENLLAHFPHLERSDLFPDWRKYDSPSNLPELDIPCDFSPELAALMASMAALLEEAERHTGTMRRDFQRSTSWRLTAPLRALRRRTTTRRLS